MAPISNGEQMKRSLVGAAVAASFTVAALGATGTASAAPMHEGNTSHHGQAGAGALVEPRSLDQCTGGRICVWENTNFSGDWTSLIAEFPGQCDPIHGGGRSYYNNSAYTQRVWAGGNCTGPTTYVVPPGGIVPDNGWAVNSVGGYP